MSKNAKEIYTVEGSKVYRSAHVGSQDFALIKDQCSQDEVLFEDPHFPADNTSVFYSNNILGEFDWKRPSEICDDPKFFVSGATRFDVKQGQLRDCWFLAAVASLTLNEKLFQVVVPEENTFEEGEYCGAFHFRFWQYGKWVDVVVDDRLPTRDGQLLLMHSVDSNEFWSALLEKAYAKLHGSYEALDGGHTTEAMTDFTGGITELFRLGEAPENLFEAMEKAFRHSSFMGCSISADASNFEERTNEGLVQGHAYSITGIVTLPDTETRLLRVRNPWGNEVEWSGAWNDSSEEWDSITDDLKEELGLTIGADGEFWMSFDDFVQYFEILEICHLAVDFFRGEDDEEGGDEQKRWQCKLFNGQWICGATAGGCENYLESFPYNPQYVINLTDPDEDDDNQQCTMLISLMQKNRRAQRKHGRNCLYIGFELYSLTDPDSQAKPLPPEYFYENGPDAVGPSFVNTREVAKRFSLYPGTYVIVPSTFEPNEEGDFVLRVYTQAEVEMVENEGVLGHGTVDDRVTETLQQDDDYNAKIEEYFNNVAGDDGEMGWSELKDALDTLMREEFEFEDGFSQEVCKSMVAIMDTDMTGKLGFDEFAQLWKSIRTWTAVFKLYDNDSSGHLDAYELRQALTSAGYCVTNKILQVLQLRYGDSSGNVLFDNFIMCAIKLKNLIDTFLERSGGEQETNFSLEDWLKNTLYT